MSQKGQNSQFMIMMTNRQTNSCIPLEAANLRSPLKKLYPLTIFSCLNNHLLWNGEQKNDAKGVGFFLNMV